jgi:hypothetical protein
LNYSDSNPNVEQYEVESARDELNTSFNQGAADSSTCYCPFKPKSHVVELTRIAAATRATPLLCAPLIRHARSRVNINGPSTFISQLEGQSLVMPFGLNTPRDRPPRELLKTLPG